MKSGRQDRELQFCQTSFLQRNQLIEMKLLVEEITMILKMMDITPLLVEDALKWTEESKFLMLRMVMFGAFYPNYFIRQSNSEIEQLANRTLLCKDPKNTVYLEGMDHVPAMLSTNYAYNSNNYLKKSCKAKIRSTLTLNKSLTEKWLHTCILAYLVIRFRIQNLTKIN